MERINIILEIVSISYQFYLFDFIEFITSQRYITSFTLTAFSPCLFSWMDRRKLYEWMNEPRIDSSQTKHI